MSVTGRWKITAPRSPRRGENWQLQCGALDGQVIPAGESVIVVPEQQLQGAVRALEEIVRIGTTPRDSMLSTTRQYRERGQAMVDAANAALGGQ